MKNKRKLQTAGASVVVLLLLLSACSPGITEGEVVEKKFTPAHIETVMIPIIISNGESTVTSIVPYVYYYNDEYTITISGTGENGEIQTAKFRVSAEVYEKTPIGAEFVYERDMEPNEPVYTRERANEEG